MELTFQAMGHILHAIQQYQSTTIRDFACLLRHVLCTYGLMRAIKQMDLDASNQDRSLVNIRPTAI